MELAEIIIDKNKFTQTNKNYKETYTGKSELDILGNYQLDDGLIVKIKKDSIGFYREIYGRDPSRLKRISPSIYAYANNDNLKMKFENENGQVKSLTIFASTQEPQNAVKLPILEISNEYYPTLSGKYFNTETNTTIEIRHKEGSDYILTKNGRARNAKLIIKDYLAMNPYQILADRDVSGELIGLIVNNNRITNVKFKRVD